MPHVLKKPLSRVQVYALVSFFQSAVGIYITIWHGFERRSIEVDSQLRTDTDDGTATADVRQRLWYWYRPASSQSGAAFSPPVVVLHGVGAVSHPVQFH
eukprot:COSAG02_NODE_3451_length_6715_cov_7.265146_3_plen_99_part_00